MIAAYRDAVLGVCMFGGGELFDMFGQTNYKREGGRGIDGWVFNKVSCSEYAKQSRSRGSLITASIFDLTCHQIWINIHRLVWGGGAPKRRAVRIYPVSETFLDFIIVFIFSLKPCF